jgi:DNA-binding transcriptional regulator PaaX
MFDIPLDHRQHRAELLHRLKLLNFYKLQQSVWVHPFDCEKQIGVLLKALNVEKYVSYLVVEEGNFTDHAESHFKQQKLLM